MKIQRLKTQHFYAKLPLQKTIWKQIEWGVQNGTITKNGAFPVTILFFWIFFSVWNRLIKSLFDVQTTQMSISILFVTAGVLFEVKVFNNGPRKICGRQFLKNLKSYGLLRGTISVQIFKGCLPQIFDWSIIEYLDPFEGAFSLWVSLRSFLLFSFWLWILLNLVSTKSDRTYHYVLSLYGLGGNECF